MNWQVTSLDNYDGDLWRDWQTLAENVHKNNPMLHSLFVRQMVKYFPADIFVAKALSETDREVVALLLLEKYSKGTWRIYKPSQAQAALIVLKPNVKLQWSALISRLPSFVLKLDLFALDPVEHSSLLASLPQSLITDSAKNITIDVEGNFDDYWTGRSKSLKQNIRRYIRRIENTFDQFNFEVTTTPEKLEYACDQYGLIESRGWKGKAGTSLHPGNVQGTAYRNILKDFGQIHKAAIFELKINEEVVASRLCIIGAQKAVMLKTTFEESFKRYAVGKVLLFFSAKYIFDNQLATEIDFYTNATKDQIDWATNKRTMSNATVYKLGLLNTLVPKLKALKNKVNTL